MKPIPRDQFFLVLSIALLLSLAINVWTREERVIEIAYSDFKTLARDGHVHDAVIREQSVSGNAAGAALRAVVPAADMARFPDLATAAEIAFTAQRIDDPSLPDVLDAAGVRYRAETAQSWPLLVLSWIVPTLLFVGIWMFALRRMAAQGMGSAMAIGKSKARVYVQKNIGVKFSDVEGIDAAKQELMEVVEFLRAPEKYTCLGGHIPKGVLIVGAPGTGKTLLAKAVAGEANVPFLSISGSEFVEMFVGVGAARVRDLFEQAATLAPCIIFIDELDALGKARGVGGFGGHEEREQTLNQLLVELDGFDTNKGVIIMAATNRPEILDPALLRPGRFDRKIAIDRPDMRGRERILRLHAGKLVLDPGVDLGAVAAKTPGLAGADLANIVNEAALHAARESKPAVSMSDFDAAIDRTIAGLEQKNRVMNPAEKRTVAYHEAGHALVAELRPTTDKVAKVSIIPRGIGALGFTQQLPTEDRYLMKRSELLDRLDVLLAGRVAEQLIFGEASTGAQNDLQRATDLVRHMVVQYGMSALGPAVFDARPTALFPNELPLTRQQEYSEETARRIDAEVQTLLQEAEARVTATLSERRATLEALAALLLEHETVERHSLVRLLDNPPTGRLSVVETGH